MAGPYGSAAKPVRLDPFRRIVEVHWNPERYIAFSVLINRDPEVGWAVEACDFGPPEPVPSALSGVYATTVSYVSLNREGRPFDSAWVLKGQSWQALAPEQVELAGMPSLPGAQSFGPWEVKGSSHDNDPETPDDLDSRQPYGRWQETTGPALEIKLPTDGTAFFSAGDSATFDLIGQPFVGGPVCYLLATGVVYFMLAPFGPMGAIDGSHSNYSVASATVTYKGKTYRPIGVKTVNMSDVEAVPVGPGMLLVLCERQDT